MTSPLAAVGLTFDGVDLQLDDLTIFLEITRGLAEPPSVRGVDVIVPGLPGTIEANRINHTLSILLEGFVRADPDATTLADAQASFAATRAAVRTLFATNRERALLVATLEDGSVVSISARPMNSAWVTIVPSQFASVSIELEGSDDWSAVEGS